MSPTGEQLRRAARSLRRRLGPGPGPRAAAGDAAPPDPGSATAMLRWCMQHRPEAASRPHYLWGTLQAACEARSLGLAAISVAEFGVAGGNGILALEAAAGAAEDLLGVGVSVFGFDAATGMPAPRGHRDLPWAIKPGYFAMDVEALRRMLTRAELVLGPVGDTVVSWLDQDRAPVGFVSFDLDYHSSTVEALQLFDARAERLMPRVVCYFDDVFGYGWTDFTGERAAIAEFNGAHHDRKLGAIYGLRYELPESEWRRPWHEQMYVAHLFDHPRYDDFVLDLPPAWFDAHRLRGS